MFVDIQGFLIHVEKIIVIWIKENKILLDFDGSNFSSLDSCISLDYDEDFLKFISEIDYFVCDIDYDKNIADQEIYALNIDSVGYIDHKDLSDQRKIAFFVKKIYRRSIVKKISNF